MSNYILHNGELCHYGVPGMKWGVRKAKYTAKAEAYRKAASDSDNEKRAAKLNAKADKMDNKAAALDTSKGRAAYTAKKAAVIGAAVVATTLAAGFAAKKISEVSKQKGFDAGFLKGNKEGQAAGFKTGFTYGREQGGKEGYSIGKSAGYSKGRRDGWDAGRTFGYKMGNKDGTASGFQAGRTKGRHDTLSGIRYTTGSSKVADRLEKAAAKIGKTSIDELLDHLYN